MITNATEHDISQLNSFLRGELSACESYSLALDKIDEAEHKAAARVLSENMTNHKARAQEIRSEVLRLGGEASDESGAWGTFAKAVQGGAALFGDSAAVAALEEGEDHGLRNYKNDLENLSPPVRQFVDSRLLPEQQKTHDALAALKKSM